MKKLSKKHYLFTSESVSESHPDLVAERIVDQVLDNLIAFDPETHCGLEGVVTTGLCVIVGEVKSKSYVDIPTIVRKTIKELGYDKAEYGFAGDACGVLTGIHEQSSDIDMGVTRENPEDQGAGDQGIMFGYAVNETPEYMPATISIAHKIMKTIADIRKNEKHLMPYLRPDGKCQVTIEYDENNKPVRIDNILVSNQHEDVFSSTEEMQSRIKNDIINIVIPKVKEYYDENIQKLFDDKNIIYNVNPTGKWVNGSPAQDSGTVGRKLIVNSYGGWAQIGGGAQSGKSGYDKTDRSAMYMTRYVAKNLVAAGVADRVLIQLSYGIGLTRPLSIYVNTYGTNHTKYEENEIAEIIDDIFDLTPYGIAKQLKLKTPIYAETVAYGQVGQEPRIVHKHFENKYGDDVDIDVELFTWEKLDAVDKIKEAFNL